MKIRKVTLKLEGGYEFRGTSFGYEKAVNGEVVFNTAMMGYPESLTDPSYSGQILVMTFPLVGNYGVPSASEEANGLSSFYESDHIHVRALVVSDYSEEYSHWNANRSLAQWLKEEKVVGIEGIDTRELTKILREHGSMPGKIVFDDGEDIEFEDPNLVNQVDIVSTKVVEHFGEGKKKVCLVDMLVSAPGRGKRMVGRCDAYEVKPPLYGSHNNHLPRDIVQGHAEQGCVSRIEGEEIVCGAGRCHHAPLLHP